MITNEHIEQFIAQAHRYGDAKLMLCSSGNLSWRIGEEALISGTGSWVPTLGKGCSFTGGRSGACRPEWQMCKHE